MLTGFVRSLFAYSAAAFLSAGLLQAQDAQESFQKGVRLLQQSKDAEALEAFREALNADPSNEEAFELWKQTEQRIWTAMLMKRGEYEKIARALLRRATIARQARSSDEALIAPLVEKALGDDASARRAANFKLASDHGEFAVPFLVEALGNVDEGTRQDYAILACEAIGRHATLPLIQCLQSSNKTLRLNAALALSYIGDTRAVPGLLRLAQAEGEDVGVREVASRAVAKISGKSGSALESYLAYSKDYLSGNPLLLREGDISNVVWSFKDGELKSRPVPTSLFALELAKDSAYGALQVDPNNEEALVCLAQVYLAQQSIVHDTLAKDPDSDMAEMGDSVKELGITVLAAGPKVIRKAVNASTSAGMWSTAVRGMHVLAELEDSQQLDGSPLVEGLKSPDKRIRTASSVALSKMGAKLSVKQAQDVVRNLARASLERSVRIVRYLDESASSQALAKEASSDSTGTIVEASSKTAKFLADLRLFPNVDVIVFNENLKNYKASEIIRYIKQTSALANAKIVVVSNDVEKAQDRLGDKVDGFVAAPVTAKKLKACVGKVLEGVELSEKDKRSNKTAVQAVEALSSLDTKRFNISEASAELSKVAKRGAAVAIPAIRALGRSAGNDMIPTLIEILKRSETAASVRIAAASAIGSIMGRSGKLSSDALAALKSLAIDMEQSSEIRAAAVAALGKSPISASERAELLRKLRVDPSTELDG